ncbi:MAG TPA: acetyl-CoA C-acyltransferase [Chloroflexota bacterium]|jgi:acetyl-CoA acyltransferase|nr:acetyl-CoA C-acyltransferase [Chloroflexota bacterium]
MKEAVIVTAVRTPVGKAPRGTLRTTRPDDLAALVIRAAVERTPGLEPSQIEDVIMGCAMPEAQQGMNVARIASLRAGLGYQVPAQTVNRFCSSGLQAIALAGQQIMSGMGSTIIAGGTESMSMVPMSGNDFAPNPWLAENYPAVYVSMGMTAENVAREFKINRDDQDAFALRSHQRALAAQAANRFAEELVPVEVEQVVVGPSGPQQSTRIFSVDEGPRKDTSAEALASLKPVFHVKGTVTAGNSSQMSDGAAAVVVMEAEKARSLGLKPLARFVSFAVGGVRPEIMGIGPIAAVPRALKFAGLSLSDIDLIELNEAFAAQSLAVIRELGFDEDKVNVNGGAIALGHPLGCTGAKLTTQLLHELARRGGRYGMVTMCIGSGMGAAGIFELVFT